MSLFSNYHQPLLPRPANIPPPSPDPPDKSPKRGHTTACTSCRNRKVKCDAIRPTCSTCQQGRISCTYEVPVGMTRQRAAKQINENTRAVVEILRDTNEEDAVAILQRIRQEENLDDVLENIAAARSSYVDPNTTQQARGAYETSKAGEAGPSSLGGPLLTSSMSSTISIDYDALSPESGVQHLSRAFQHEYIPIQNTYVERDMHVEMVELTPWTNTSDDNGLMNHLLSLFWTWDNHVERILYRPLFEEDIRRGVEGHSTSNSFCSSFLVNALLALSCLYSMDTGLFTSAEDRTGRGRQFAEEAERHLDEEKYELSVPLLQGLYAMHWYEGNLGSGHKSIYYFHEASKTFRGLNHPDFLEQQADTCDGPRLQRESEGLSWVMWGFYCAEWRTSQGLGLTKFVKKPLVSQLWTEPDFTLAKPDSPEYWWFPYPISSQAQRSMKVEIREYDVRLSDIVQDIMRLFDQHETHSQVTLEGKCERAVALYSKLQAWTASLPPHLRVEEAVLPRAILLHCCGELMVTALLRPFSVLSQERFGAFDPRERCYRHACNLGSAIWHYRAFAPLQNEYWLTYALSHVTFITLDAFDKDPPHTEALIKACQCLKEMSATLPLAADILSVLKSQVERSRMQLPHSLARFFDDNNNNNNNNNNNGKGRRDGLLHHTLAPLMPARYAGVVAVTQTLRLQDLFDDFEDLTMDG